MKHIQFDESQKVIQDKNLMENKLKETSMGHPSKKKVNFQGLQHKILFHKVIELRAC